MPNKVSNQLIALSSAAILAVYGAGYHRTSAAADRFAAQERLGRIRDIRQSPDGYLYVASRGMAVPQTHSAVVPGVTPAKPVPRAPIATTALSNSSSSASAAPELSKALPHAASTAPYSEVASSSVSSEIMTPAPAAVPAAVVPDDPKAPAAIQYKDGTFLGWGYSRHGDIQAFVRIHDGRIVAAGIEKCWTRYSCSWIEHLPPQVVARQSADVDYVTGATESVNAFYGGIVEALKLAK